MPNVGRPSKGCKHCRDRKVKCDQKRPSCSQCIRSGKECHGYRDALSMMFKDETAVVAKKAKRRYEALATQSPPSEVEVRTKQTNGSKALSIFFQDSDLQSPRSSSSGVSRYATPNSMVREVVPSIEDQAICFFIANHVSQPSLVPRGQYEWVLEALNQPDCEVIVRSSVNAATLAALANSTKSPVIVAKAQAAYCSALGMTNSALRVRKTAVKDSTLIAVIMLGLYEHFAFQDKRSMDAWVKHVQGACALLHLRGQEQFESNMAIRIFFQFYGIVLLMSLETGQRIPDGMRAMYDYCNTTADYAVHGRQWTTRLTKFMHAARDLNADKESDAVTLVTKALRLDRELDSIKALMPKVWQYETVRLEQPSKYAHGSFYHIYTDPWIGQMWNNLRICRMHLYRTIREQLWKGYTQVPALFSRDEVERQICGARQVLQTTMNAICASVPQLTGMVPFPQQLMPVADGSESAGPDAAHIYPPGTFLDPVRSTCMYHLIWPLYAAGVSDLSSKEMREYAISTLYFIALRIGTRQAVVLAESLKEKEKEKEKEKGRAPQSRQLDALGDPMFAS